MIGTIIKAVLGAIVATVIDRVTRQIALGSPEGQGLHTQVYSILSADDVLGMALALVGTFVIPNVYLKQVFAIAFGVLVALELYEYLELIPYTPIVLP